MGISEKLTYLNETKDLIKQAIVNKGVQVKDTDTFRSYANKISTIENTGGTTEDLTEELLEQDNLITTQETTIEDIIEALEGKSAGGGGINPKVEENVLILSSGNVKGGVLNI